MSNYMRNDDLFSIYASVKKTVYSALSNGRWDGAFRNEYEAYWSQIVDTAIAEALQEVFDEQKQINTEQLEHAEDQYKRLQVKYQQELKKAHQRLETEKVVNEKAARQSLDCGLGDDE